MKIIKTYNFPFVVIQIIIITLFFFILSSFFFESSLNNLLSLSKEISSSPEKIFQYKITEIEPFKFRILFSSIVKTTYSVLSNVQNNNLFYYIYLFWSGVFYLSGSLSFFFLLKSLGFNKNYTLMGVLLFLTNPAILFAYSLPIHTREDMLAYTILNISLVFILRNNILGVLIFSILGVLCRETLLLIPLVFLFYTNSNIFLKIIIFFIPSFMFLFLRITLGGEGYDVFGQGLMYNIENFDQTLGFLFLVFSFMWPAFLFDIYYTRFKYKKFNNSPISLLRKSAPIVFILVLLSTFFAGRINEIRLLFILFPWVIPIFLSYYQRHLYPISKKIYSKEYKLFIILNGIVCFMLFLLVYFNDEIFIRGKYNIPYLQWIILTCTYLFISFSSIPLYFEMIKRHQRLY